jgi:hypothetical protein
MDQAIIDKAKKYFFGCRYINPKFTFKSNFVL